MFPLQAVSNRPMYMILFLPVTAFALGLELPVLPPPPGLQYLPGASGTGIRTSSDTIVHMNSAFGTGGRVPEGLPSYMSKCSAALGHSIEAL